MNTQTSRRTSVFWKVSREELVRRLDAADSMAEVVRGFGLCYQGSNHKTLKNRMNCEGIDLQHYKRKWSEVNKAQARELVKSKSRPLQYYLVEGRLLGNRTRLKSRIIGEGLLKNICNVCGVTEWMGKPLTLDLHHINGVSTDNRIENLSLLCPNCHRQTENFGRKNRHKPKIKPTNPYGIGVPKMERRKVERPSKEELIVLIEECSWVALGKRFGVSDNAVRKWAKFYGLLPLSPPE